MNSSASNYSVINAQEIFCKPEGTILNFNNNFLKLKEGDNLFNIHPFFESIEHSINLKKDEIQTYPCVHLDIDGSEYICDISFKNEPHQLTVYVLDYSDAYKNLNDIAQERNESVIKSQLLILKNQQLEKEKDFKNKFLANISHEIRSPLNAIFGFSELLNKTKLNFEQLELLQVILKANEQLTAIIDDMLDVAKIEMGEITIKKEEFSLKDLVAHLSKIYSQKCEKKFLDFKLDYDDNIKNIVIGDEVRVQQVLENLLQNAVKYTSQGTVNFSVNKSFQRANNLGITFTVKDTGIGIPQDKINNIFDNFFQVDDNGTSEGTGLGLSITKNLVELLGGKIAVESTLSKGSTFTIYLPFKINILESSKKLQNKLPIRHTPQRLEKYNLLLVDNSEINQLLVMKTLLNHGGFHVDVAVNGEKALKYIELRDYDVILMDLKMPVLNGIETTKAIRNLENPILKKIPIVALTGFASKEQRKECLKAGMNDYLTKPFKQEELIKILESIFQ